MAKQMWQLNTQRTTTEKEFRGFFTNAMINYKQFQQKGLDTHLEIQQLLTESEGMRILKASEESWKKSEKIEEFQFCTKIILHSINPITKKLHPNNHLHP